MKMTIAVLVTTAALTIGASGAFAQGAVIEVTPEVRTEFRTYVTTEAIAPVVVAAPLTVGAVVPAEVTLHPVPPVIIARAPELEGHHYVLVDGHIHVVHPETRAVVAVIED